MFSKLLKLFKRTFYEKLQYKQGQVRDFLRQQIFCCLKMKLYIGNIGNGRDMGIEMDF